MQSRYVVVLSLGDGVYAVERLASFSVVPIQFVAGAEPNETVAVLQDGLYFHLRQTVLAIDETEVIIVYGQHWTSHEKQEDPNAI